MSVLILLSYLIYIILFLIAIIFLITLFPLNISFLSTIDGFYYDATVDFSVLLGLLYGSVDFSSEGGSFRLKLFSLPVFSTRWVKSELEPDEKTIEHRHKKRGNIRKLFKQSIRLFDSLTKIIKVKKLDVSVTAGLSDPYIAGLIFGAAYPVFEMTQIFFPSLSFSLTPVFVEERFKSRLDGGISLRIILMVVPLLRFFLSNGYREYRRS